MLKNTLFICCILACGIQTVHAQDWDTSEYDPSDNTVVTTQVDPDTTLTTDSNGNTAVSTDMGDGTTVTTIHREHPLADRYWGN